MDINILKKEVIKINNNGGEYLSNKQFIIKNVDFNYYQI